MAILNPKAVQREAGLHGEPTNPLKPQAEESSLNVEQPSAANKLGSVRLLIDPASFRPWKTGNLIALVLFAPFVFVQHIQPRRILSLLYCMCVHMTGDVFSHGNFTNVVNILYTKVAFMGWRIAQLSSPRKLPANS